MVSGVCCSGECVSAGAGECVSAGAWGNKSFLSITKKEGAFLIAPHRFYQSMPHISQKVIELLTHSSDSEGCIHSPLPQEDAQVVRVVFLFKSKFLGKVVTPPILPPK